LRDELNLASGVFWLMLQGLVGFGCHELRDFFRIGAITIQQKRQTVAVDVGFCVQGIDPTTFICIRFGKVAPATDSDVFCFDGSFFIEQGQNRF